MKNKGFMVLIEQAVMLLVFALAAVLCLRAFVWADETSKEIAARDQALIQAQNAAEVLKHCAGDGGKAAELYGGAWDGQIWVIRYDGEWQERTDAGTYLLVAELVQRNDPYLGTADIGVFQGETCLVQLNAAWQEVTVDG